MVRARGIEPLSQAWEARVLPLNDARECQLTSYRSSYATILTQAQISVNVEIKK